MTTKDNGGDSFPMSTPSDIYPGMTLRDWFAGQAMAAFVGAIAVGRPDAVEKALKQSGTESVWELAAVEGYGYADAMIAERSKSDTPPTNTQTGAK